MRQTRNMLIASAVMLLAALPAAAAESQKVAARGGVMVHHGASIEVVPSSGRAKAGTVTVHRGSGAKGPSKVGLARKTGTIQVVGGDGQVWFIDAKKNRLTNCRFRVTSTVGRDQIRCIRRKLPN